jgi:ribosomal protein S18 acetylase RimI-like enzyme
MSSEFKDRPRPLLRPAGIGDQDFLLKLYVSTRTEELDPIDWKPGERAAFERMQFEAQRRHYLMHFPGSEHSLVLWRGEPAGRIYVYRTEKEILLADIAFLPEFRGLGLGGSLMQDLVDEGLRTHRKITLHVWRYDARSFHFYQRYGFVPVAQDDTHITMERQPSGPPPIQLILPT